MEMPVGPTSHFVCVTYMILTQSCQFQACKKQHTGHTDTASDYLRSWQADYVNPHFPKVPPPPTFPHHFRYLFVKHFIMQVGNYYTGISTSCSACTSVGTVSGNASQVTYTMDTQISISLLNIRTRCWSSQEEAGEMKLEKHLIFACFAPSMKYRNDSCGNLVHFRLQLK